MTVDLAALQRIYTMQSCALSVTMSRGIVSSFLVGIAPIAMIVLRGADWFMITKVLKDLNSFVGKCL